MHGEAINMALVQWSLTRAKLENLNFEPLQVVSRYCDPQHQVGKTYICTISMKTFSAVANLIMLIYLENSIF